MIARLHYDDETLGQLLHEEAAGLDPDVEAHVETCAQCQSRLETITQQGLTWDEAGELLRVGPAYQDDLAPGDSGNEAVDSKDRHEEIDVTNNARFLEPSEHPDSLGRFGRYEIIAFLGRGGMGIVMRGFDPALNRYSAVKVLAPELASNAAARKRFSREAKSAAAVVHPHVVPIQTVDTNNGLPYLVMPVVEGRSLQERVQDDGPLSVIETVRIAAQVAEGLAAAHAQGLVHRDIKPANILLENGVERVQITDFGLARAADDASMTRSGVIAGTPQYMSPEQAHGDEIDHRSDLFSLGSVIYFMLTGRSPFRAETTMGVLNRIANDQPRRLRSVQPEVPAWLETLVARLLQKSPSKRFDTAESAAEVLNLHLSQLQDPTFDNVSASTSWFRNIRPPVTLTALGVAGMSAFLYLALIVLPSKEGTIQIETNPELKAPVPLIIKRGNEVVERLIADSDGATTRVRAGVYSIEFEGDGTALQLGENKATVLAGEVWTTKIEFRPNEKSSPANVDGPTAIRMDAKEDARHGRFEQALEKTLWCWENAIRVQPSWSAVRRSFLLSDWLALGEEHPPALEKLRSVRDDLEGKILSEDQVRVRWDEFADYAAINRTLRQDKKTLELFEKVKSKSAKDAERIRLLLPDDEPVAPSNPDAVSPGAIQPAVPPAPRKMSRPVHEDGEADLSTPQATLLALHRHEGLGKSDFPSELFTEEALLELSGMSLQSLIMLSGLSQITAQTGGILGSAGGGPTLLGAPSSFHLLVDELLEEHKADSPPKVASEAFELLAKLTLGAALSPNESPARPDRDMFRLAAGILKSPAEFIPAAGKLIQKIDGEPDPEESESKPKTPPEYEIVIEGDVATATAVRNTRGSDADGSSPPTTTKLRRINGRWLVSQIVSDEDIAVMQASMSGLLGEPVETSDSKQN